MAPLIRPQKLDDDAIAAVERSAKEAERSAKDLGTHELSTTVQDYLKVIWSLGEHGDAVTTKAIAERLGVTPPTVSQTVRRLADQGFVAHERFGSIDLTPLGRAHAVQMVRRHRLLETFLVTSLGYGWDEVHVEAEELEHAASDQLIERIDALLGSPKVDPHGDPIPTADGTLDETPFTPLTALPAGAQAAIVRISDDDPQLLRYCAEQGLVPGAHISITPADPYAETVHIQLANGTTIALGRRAAAQVFATVDA